MSNPYARYKSSTILELIGRGLLSVKSKEQAWAELSRRAHTNSVEGAWSTIKPEK